MTYTDKKNKVVDFFTKFIEGFICKDLEVLHLIQPDKVTGLGGCTIPTAMTVISSIDLLGFLLNRNGDVNKSSQNIEYFLNYSLQSDDLFPRYYRDKIDKISNYRHGMMHHFFPKFKGKYAGICKDMESNTIFVNHNVNEQLEESLNVFVLCQDFLFSIKKLGIYLKNNPEEEMLDFMINGLWGLDYSLEMYPKTIIMTTINPGTPKNK